MTDVAALLRSILADNPPMRRTPSTKTIGDRLYALTAPMRAAVKAAYSSDFELAWQWAVLESRFADFKFWELPPARRAWPQFNPIDVVDSFILHGPGRVRRLDYTSHGIQMLTLAADPGGVAPRMTIQEYNFLYETTIESDIERHATFEIAGHTRMLTVLGRQFWWTYEITHEIAGKGVTRTYVQVVDEEQLARYLTKHQIDPICLFRCQTSQRFLSNDEYYALFHYDRASLNPIYHPLELLGAPQLVQGDPDPGPPPADWVADLNGPGEAA